VSELIAAKCSGEPKGKF
jgi:hypothetical protein